VREVPTPVWGRDELQTGEMWSSNSLISWLITRSGLDVDSIHPPSGGRAPGWHAGRGNGTPAAGAGDGIDQSGSGEGGSEMTIKKLAGAVTVAVGGAVLYRKLLRQPILTWGATDEEAEARLPGDELLEDADGVATRAITIEAPAAAVWPWIAQMGPSPRGGAYTYDWIENLLGLNMHSADTVLADYQHPQVGEGFGYGANKMSYRIVEPEHVLATQSADGNWVWSFILDEQDGRTRVISRNRFRLPRLRDKLRMIPMEPGSLVMERKMLCGIKQRAEELASQQRESARA
jgi:hypothetical protein